MQTVVTAVHVVIVCRPYSGEREVFQEEGHRDEEQKRIFLCLLNKSESQERYGNSSFDSDDVLPPNCTELD